MSRIETGTAPAFPAFHEHLSVDEPFAKRWRFKRDLYQRFRTAWSRAQECVANHFNGETLPEAVTDDWEARWVKSVFVGTIAAHDSLNPAEAAESASNLAEVVAALLFVRPLAQLASAKRVWVLQYSEGIRLSPCRTWTNLDRTGLRSSARRRSRSSGTTSSSSSAGRGSYSLPPRARTWPGSGGSRIALIRGNRSGGHRRPTKCGHCGRFEARFPSCLTS